MISNFRIHLENLFPFLSDKKLLLTVSGGIDSMVLLDLMHSLNYNIEVSHCNFQLRGEDSIQDQLLVEKKCKELNLTFHSIKFETKKIAEKQKKSIQIIARELRYNWFYGLLKEYSLDYILTAHHLNDSIETFIFNLSRGTGLKGLIGIPELNNRTVRPLLHFSKSEIIKYALEKKLEWREDSSNDKTIYGRNFIRHKIIPELVNLNKEFIQNFRNSQTILKDNQEIIDAFYKKIKQDLIRENGAFKTISIQELLNLNPINSAIFQIFSDFGFYSIPEINKLILAETGSRIESKTHVLLKNREEILIKPIGKEPNNAVHIIHLDEDEFVLENPIKLQFKKNNTIGNGCSITVDLDKVKLPLKIKKWKAGDFFYPFGTNNKKKVSKFFKDIKLSVFEKDEVWLLSDTNDSIVWIINHRSDERFKITENTKNFLHIKLID